jgi:hypothetical protein
MVTVACVYKPGKGFTEEYVYRLREAILKQSTPLQFRCITTDKTFYKKLGDEGVLIPDVLPGWWNKMFLYSGVLLDSRIVYFDLDTIITGDLTPLLTYDGEVPLFLDDFYYPGKLATGIMAFDRSQLYHLFDKFMTKPSCYIKTHDRGGRSDRGDQAFVRNHLNVSWASIQSIQEGVCSYKRDILNGKPSMVNVVSFHGKPHPHEVQWRV